MKNYCNIIKSKTTIVPTTILEIGSRDAEDANLLKKYFGIEEKSVYVVEPNPSQQKLIEEKYPNFNLIKNAIFNKKGKMIFNAVQESDLDLIGVSSLLNRKDNLYFKINSRPIHVESITGKELLFLIGKEIDLCKIDVEGATYEVLISFEEGINKIKSFHLECEHVEIWSGETLYNDIKKFLEKMEFIQIYFNYVNGVTRQSDSIWVHKNYLKI